MLAALAAVLGLAIVVWVALATVVTTLTHLLPHGGRAAHTAQQLDRAITPAVLRRFLALAVAGALVSGAAPAHAAPAATATSAAAASAAAGPAAATSPDGSAGSLDPGWAPSPVTSAGSARATYHRTATTLDPSWRAATTARPGAYPLEDVVVRRGDTLWDIAARHLGPAATDAEIAQAWPHWFTANRALIGPDPDHLTPGQRLHPPTHRAGGMP